MTIGSVLTDKVYFGMTEKTSYITQQKTDCVTIKLEKIQEDKSVTLFSIYKDKQDNFWLGTHEEGAYKFNGDQFEKFTP